jgi:transcriptional regulator with XRE-family HTH domain
VWVKPRDYKIVGEQMTAARKAASVTQDELAARLQKPQSFVSAYERGNRRIDLLEFLIVMDAIKTDPHPVFSKILEQATAVVKRARRPSRKRR